MSRILFRLELDGYTVDNNFKRWCKREGITVRRRVTMNAFGGKGLRRAWIVSYEDYYRFVVFSGWVNRGAMLYDITGCNKQYVCSFVPGEHSIYLGSMCQVTHAEAQAHVLRKDGWSLMDTETSTIWIAQKRNPDRISSYVSHGIEDAAASPWPVDPNSPRHGLQPELFRADAEVSRFVCSNA